MENNNWEEVVKSFKEKAKAKNVNGKSFKFKEGKNKFFDYIKKMDDNRKGLNIFLLLLITAVIMFVIFFFLLPSLNYMSGELYGFLITGLIVFNVLNLLLGKVSLRKTIIPSLGLAGIFFIVPIILSFFSAPLFRAKSYANLISIKSSDFKDVVEKIVPNKIPIVDREAAIKIGDKELGSIPDLVSQFDIDENYAQLTVAGEALRVSPLKYNDIFKYFSNMKNGIQYYVSVNMANQQGDLVKLNKPIMYSKSDILMRNIFRKVRFQYPFLILGETNFEIDDEGNAFYVTPVLTKRIGFINGLDSDGVIVTDANSGESRRYGLNEVPEWVDRVYPSELIIEQLNLKGKYNLGFFNSIFGQKGVTKTTEGYNYIPMGNDVYLFTGVTSVMSDASNIGFYFVNLRTKESSLVSVASADELSAMGSAEGAVKEKGYKSTFPIILNIGDKPVYLLSLKDNTMTAKMFALVDAAQFTNVAVGNSVQEVIGKFNVSFNPTDKPGKDSKEVSVTISKLKEFVIDGNTILFIQGSDNKVYVAPGKILGVKGAFLKEGDVIKVFGNDRGDQFDVLELR